MSNPCPPEQANVANIALGDPVANPRGGKACSITPAVRLTLQDVTTPFQVTAYDGASSRKSLDLRSRPSCATSARAWTPSWSPSPAG